MKKNSSVARRLSILVAILVAIAVLAGCAQSQGAASAPAASAAPAASSAPAGDAPASGSEGTATVQEGKVNVAVIPSDMSDDNLAYTVKVLEKYCAEKDYNVLNYDPRGNAQTQANMISNAVAQKATAVVFDPIDSAALGPAIMEAHEAGVIVVTVVGDIDEMYHEYRDSYVGPDDLAAGQMAADCFKEAFPDGAKVVAIEGAAGHSAQIRRHDGFAAGIEGTGIEVIDNKAATTWSPSDCMTIAEDFIVRYGEEIDGIFCHWDNGAVGVAEALKGAGYEAGDVFMVGVDGCYAGFDLVREGWMYASVMQDVDTMCKTAIANIETILAGGTVEPIINPDLILVTKDNVDDIDPGW